MRGYTLHDHADGYIRSVHYGLHGAVLTAKRGGARRFARIDTALARLRTLRAAAVDVRLIDTGPSPRPYRRGRPAGAAALDRLHAEVATPSPAAPRTRSQSSWQGPGRCDM